MKKVDVIIVEDSQHDRIRMRLLLNALSLNYKFAWDANYYKVIEIDKIIDMLKRYQPSRLLIDTAWTVEDERNLSKLCFKNKYQIINNKDIWVSSFNLIKELVQNYKNNEAFMYNLRKLVIVSPYIKTVSYGLMDFIKELVDPMYTISTSFVTKWSDERRFRFIMM